MPTIETEQKKKKFKLMIPDVLILLMARSFVAMLLTWIVPAGVYDRFINEMGREVVDPNTFHNVEAAPQGLFAFFKAFHTGLSDNAGIIFFLFIVGGSFNVVQETGAIEAGLCKVTRVMAGKERLIIPVIMFVFALCGATIGMAEEALPFIPIMVTLAISMGFDSMTGAAMVLVGCSAGFAGAFLSPFTVGIAQGIAGLPAASGMGFRFFLFAAMNIVMITFVYRYAGKVKKNPQLSPMYDIDRAREDKLDMSQMKQLEKKHVFVLIVMFVCIAVFAYGVTQLGWYVTELSAVFLIMAVLSAIVCRYSVNEFAASLTRGMLSMTYACMIVGFSKAILVLLTNGVIMDTILHAAAGLVDGLPKSLAAIGMYIFQCLLNFLIPSASGQAAVSIPILAPLGDIIGITRQTAVLAFQLGDGISNIWTPTSGYFMAALAMAKVPWQKWAKWFMPCFLLEYLVGAIFVIIAVKINYGPF